MNERLSQTPSLEEQEKQELEQYILLTEKLSKNLEGFAFPGINEEWYLKLKATDDEYPGYTTPIDEIVSRMKTEGLKVVFSKDLKSANALILPLGSNDPENDMILPGYLEINDGMDESLKALILSNKKRLVSFFEHKK
jgi:hypothetical protein